MNSADVIVTILSTIITAVITYCGNLLIKNNRALTVFRIIEPLAKDAVVASQKLGVNNYLTGMAKKNHAVQIVTQVLTNAGFTVKDEQVIVNAVEKAFAEQRDLLAKYPQATEPDKTAEELEKAKELVSQKEAELVSAKEKVAELTNA